MEEIMYREFSNSEIVYTDAYKDCTIEQLLESKKRCFSDIYDVHSIETETNIIISYIYKGRLAYVEEYSKKQFKK